MKSFILTFALLLVSETMAHIINVPANYATIQDGINAAVKGETVLVAEGIHVENINYENKVVSVASDDFTSQDTLMLYS
ncbi:hypothetical protein JW998_08100 [candidate division KSB1 bacterium]|nr:hypothetical protein [candidate division KSB1 bacterium]